MSYHRQLDVFGNESVIIAGPEVVGRPTLFECVDQPDPTYAGTVAQSTLDGRTVASPPPMQHRYRED